MNKKIIIYVLSFILFACTISKNTFVVYAGDESDGMELFGKNYDALSTLGKISVWLTYCTTATGQLISADVIKAQDTMNECIRYVNGINYEKKISEMTESELQEVLDNFKENLESKGCKCDSNGKVTLSDDFIKEFRSWLDTYMEENNTPLYYTVHVSNFSDLKASNCHNTYFYNTIKNAIEKYGVIATRFCNGKLYIYDLSDFENNYFLINSNITKSSNGNILYCAFPYNKTDELQSFVNYIAIDFSDDTTPLSDFENDYRITSKSKTLLNLKLNSIDYYNSFTSSWNISDSSYMYIFSKSDIYAKSFTSIANYQNYITSTAEQKIYYTSNYFKTENIQQSPIGLDEMVKLYEAYDDLCKKIIQYVQDTSNATDTMIVNKLDELIKAVYSSSGSGSTDVDVSVDMSETNSLLDKIFNKLDEILKAIKAIGNIEIIDLGEDNPITEWTNNITNMVVNPEANIDATIGDISGSMDEPITLLKTKFPFSIPWDIAFLLEFLADSPETPKFEIPMKFESMNIDEKLTIDFSHFESVSKVSRMLLTLLFMVALMNLTTKVFNIGGASND